MMDDKTPVIFLFAGIIIAALIFFPWGKWEAEYLPADNVSFDFSMDKEVYHSGDGVEMNVSVPPEGVNLTLKVRGIKDSGGRFRISEEREIAPSREDRVITLGFRLPSCYGCAGVSEGNYTVYCEILSNGSMIYNGTRTIELRK